MDRIVELPFIRALKDRLDSGSNFIQVLLGPRQVGKTTSVLKLIEDHYRGESLYVAADDVFSVDKTWLMAKWQEAITNKKILFVDEIQKLSHWSDTVKFLYDEGRKDKKPIRCVLLGSSSLEIQKGLVESLAGRFQLTRAFHWNFKESKVGFGINFEDYLKYGGYPGSYSLIGRADWISYVQNSIITSVVERDILQYHSVKNPSLFRQAFELLCSYPAREVSYTKLLGQLQDKGNVELIKHYIRLFEGAYLIKTLEKFSTKPIKIKTSSPKILPLAPCLPYMQTRSEYSQEEKGRMFELIVGLQLVRTEEELFYWREGTKEVDYVLKKGRNIWGIEVKSGRKQRDGGVLTFKSKFPTAKIVFITPQNYELFESDPIAFLESNAV